MQEYTITSEDGNIEATVLDKNVPGFKGEVWHVKLSWPVTNLDWNDNPEYTFDHVLVSAVSSVYATETYLFPSDEDAEVVSWGELPGSMRGVVPHEEALQAFLDRVDLEEGTVSY